MTSSHQNKDALSSETGRKEAVLTPLQSSLSGHPYLPLSSGQNAFPEVEPTVSHQLRWDRANRHAKRAHAAVAAAVRRGQLQRGPCEVCGAIHGQDGAVIHGHHEDYSRPLDVVWLCRSHHRHFHAIVRAGLWVKAGGDACESNGIEAEDRLGKLTHASTNGTLG